MSALEPGDPWTMAEQAATLDRLTSEGRGWLESVPLEVFFRPQGDRWSPAEHARHLRKSSAPLLLAYRLPGLLLRLLYGRAQKPSRRLAELRSDYRAALAAGGEAGRFAPSREPKPTDAGARRTQILEAWSSTNAALASRLAAWPEEAAEQSRIPHPLLGKLTAREMAMFTVYHTVHHLALVKERLAKG